MTYSKHKEKVEPDEFSVSRELPIHLQISRHLEERIRSGDLPALSRLPVTTALAKEYSVSTVTIQKSMARLVSLDLLERVPRRGSFIKASHTANMVGLVFGHDPFQLNGGLYLRLLELFRQRTAERGVNLKIYIDLHEATFSRALYELRHDVVHKNIKGVIAVNNSDELSRWLKKQKEIFWVDQPAIDFYQSVKTGVAYLLKQGYRRILVVSIIADISRYSEGREAFALEEKGCKDALKGHEGTVSLVRWGDTDMDGYRETKALFQQPGPRPDALFIHHDVVCRGALLALMELGIKIPSDLGLLSHGNLGCEFASPVPLTRVVIDPMEIVDGCLKLVEPSRDQLKPGGHAAPPQLKSRMIIGKSCGE